MSPAGELVVVLPRGFSEKHVPGLLQKHEAWVERAARRMETRRRTPQDEPCASLPDVVHLPAIDESWTVEYRSTGARRVMATERPGRVLVLSGGTSDIDACRRALQRWLHRKARAELEPWFRELAHRGGFSVGRVVVRSQRTRWASCSRKGAISLNVRLLFAARELAAHVMLHELCHTLRMDHSKRFWETLGRHDPEWQSHRRQLRAAWRQVPAWLEAKPTT
jgi:predicted metal-dependent hydrolase